jgi:hypothetical protein
MTGIYEAKVKEFLRDYGLTANMPRREASQVLYMLRQFYINAVMKEKASNSSA